jgi:formylglycine-generating enzyme required for sulfatase activity
MADCGGCGSTWDSKQPAPVGSFPPNKFGLYDMVGNIWEWAEDCRHPSYTNAPKDGSPWIQASSCVDRIVRGGGTYAATPNYLLSAHRLTNDSGSQFPGIGIRVGRTLVAH